MKFYLDTASVKEIQEAAEMYAGCVSGAIQKDKYLNILYKTGFTKLAIQKEKQIIIPDDIHLRIVRFVPSNSAPQTPPIPKSDWRSHTWNSQAISPGASPWPSRPFWS